MKDKPELITPSNKTLEKILDSDWPRAVQFKCNVHQSKLQERFVKLVPRHMKTADGYLRYFKGYRSLIETF